MIEFLYCLSSSGSIFVPQIRAYILGISSSVVCPLFLSLNRTEKNPGVPPVLHVLNLQLPQCWAKRKGCSHWIFLESQDEATSVLLKAQCHWAYKLELTLFWFCYSKLLGCKQKIIDLLPKIEVALNNIKEADNSVMQMQGKRQREIWHLLKIACVSRFWMSHLHFLPLQEPGDIKWSCKEKNSKQKRGASTQ